MATKAKEPDMTAIMYVNGQKVGSTNETGRLRIAEEFVLNLIEVDQTNTEHWNVVRERETDRFSDTWLLGE